jgi:hypothetical protein
MAARSPIAGASPSRHLRRVRALAAGTALSLAIAIAGAARAQPLVHVQAETRIELALGRDGERLSVVGHLRDDLGAPLVDRELVLEIHEGDERSPRSAPPEVVRTTTGGRFETTFDLPIGRYWMRAEYAGEEHFLGSVVSREVLLDHAHVTLDVQIPTGPRLDLDAPSHHVIVLARSEAGGGGLEITVSENERELARGTTSETGALELDLASESLGPPSAARLVVRSAADSHRADAQTEVPIVRFLRTELTLEAAAPRVGAGERVRMRGRLATSRGPLDRDAVSLWAIAPGSGEAHHLATALTDARGELGADIEGDALAAIDARSVVARFEADAPWLDSSESAPVEIEIETPGATPWPWIAASLAVSALAFALAGRRRRPAGTGRAALPQLSPAIELAERRSILPDSLEIGGRAIDARSDVPIRLAAVRVRRGEAVLAETATAEDGTFSLSLPAGAHAIEVEARGYEIARHRVALPHRGEWSRVVLRLRSLRELAWAPLEPIAARVLPSPDLWGVWTGRELESAARSRPPVPRALGPLVTSIERAAYAPEPPTPADLEAIRDAAAAVEQDMATTVPRGTAPDSPRR